MTETKHNAPPTVINPYAIYNRWQGARAAGVSERYLLGVLQAGAIRSVKLPGTGGYRMTGRALLAWIEGAPLAPISEDSIPHASTDSPEP